LRSFDPPESFDLANLRLSRWIIWTIPNLPQNTVLVELRISHPIAVAGTAEIGVRMRGSTDEEVSLVSIGTSLNQYQAIVFCKVNSAGQIEIKSTSNDIIFYCITAWTGSEVVAFDNTDDKALSTPQERNYATKLSVAEWIQKPYTVVILKLHSNHPSSNGIFHVRPTGSSETKGASGNFSRLGMAIVRTDYNGEFEYYNWLESTGPRARVVGYFKNALPKLNPTDVSLADSDADDGSFHNVDLTGEALYPSGGGNIVGAIIEVYQDGGGGTQYSWCLRKDSHTWELYGRSAFVGYAVVPLDSGIFEGKIKNIVMDFYFWGFVEGISEDAGVPDWTGVKDKADYGRFPWGEVVWGGPRVLDEYKTRILADIDTGTSYYGTIRVSGPDAANVEIDSATVYKYEKRIMNRVDINQDLTDIYYGRRSPTSITLELDNADEYYTDLLETEELREQTVKLYIIEFDSDTPQFLISGTIDEIEMGSTSVKIRLALQQPNTLQDLMPPKTLEDGDFSSDIGSALEQYRREEHWGRPYNLCFGWVKKVPCHVIIEYTGVGSSGVGEYYDYLIGYGPIETVDAVYRDGVIVDPVEYTAYLGNELGVPYEGFAFLRFTVEQRDFNNRLYEITADVKGLILDDPTDDLCTGGTANARGYDGGNTPAKAVDDDTATGWHDTFSKYSDGETWWDYSWSTAKQVNKVNITAGTNETRAPGNFQILGSNTGVFGGEERLIYETDSAGITWEDDEQKSFEFDNEHYFKYYRIHVQDSEGGIYAQMMEVEFIYEPRRTTRNFATVIAKILSNTTWGLGMTVDTGEQTDAEHDVRDKKILCDGYLPRQIKAQDAIDELLFLCGGELKLSEAGTWLLTIDKYRSWRSAFFGSGDDQFQNIIRVVSYRKLPTREMIKNFKLQYRYSSWYGKQTYINERSIASYGEEKSFDTTFVDSHTTADRITGYIKNLMLYSQERLTIQVGKEGRYLDVGDMIYVSIPRINVAGDFKVRGIRKNIMNNTLELQSTAEAIYEYIPS
jgi:hypothetical protein